MIFEGQTHRQPLIETHLDEDGVVVFSLPGIAGEWPLSSLKEKEVCNQHNSYYIVIVKIGILYTNFMTWINAVEEIAEGMFSSTNETAEQPLQGNCYGK